MIKIYRRILLLLVSLWSLQAYAQNRVVNGIVSDRTSVIPGVSVIDKANPSSGTVTDLDGKFSISINRDSKVLVFQALGFGRKEVTLGNQNYLEVELTEEQKGLEEVVVIGYAQQKKLTLTGAVSAVSGQEIQQSPSASLQNTLAGRLTGFSSLQRSGQPGSDGADFFVRGQSSFSGSNSPLIIVDDIEFTYSQFSRLDPKEIASVSILKDASTTAIYGIKGANGVVVVTTTRGKAGKAKVSFRSEYSMGSPTIWPKYLDAYGSAMFRTIAEKNTNALNPNPNFKPTFSDQDLELFRTGADPYGHPNVDWRKVLFRDHTSQFRNNFDISGGSERAKYFVSIGYLNQGGLVKDFSKDQDFNSNYYHKRLNYRSNLDLNVNKNMDIRLDVFGNLGETNNPQVSNVFNSVAHWDQLTPFTYPVYNPDGSLGYSYRQLNGNNNHNNIVGRLKYQGYVRRHDNNMNLVATLNHKLNFITKGLSVKGTVSFGSTYGYNRNVSRNLFPSFIYNPANDSYTPRDINVYRIQAVDITYSPGSTTRNVTLLGVLNYDRTFGNHHLYGLALINKTAKTAPNSNVTYNFVPENNVGYTGRIGYDFKDKYLFQLNVGYNGSDRFDSKKRFGFFPAVSAGWNIAEEEFFKRSVNVFSQLKLRSSYGLVGADGTNGVYSYQQIYSLGGANTSFGLNHTAYQGVNEGVLPNNHVTWEKERKLDIGLDFGLFNDKLSGAIDYFYNRRYDILTTRGAVSSVIGQGLPLVNLGQTENKGVEVELGYRDKIGKDFTYGLRANYSLARNKIVYRDEAPSNESYRLFTGRPIGAELLYQWTGFYTEEEAAKNFPVATPTPRPGDLKYADLNNDGVINSSDQYVSNYSNFPPITYGVTLNLGYKAFALSVLIQGSAGNYVRGHNAGIMAFTSQTQPIHMEYWTPERGDNARWPGAYTTSQLSNAVSYPSTFFSRKANYTRIRTAELSYALPKALISKLKMQSIRIYTNAFNLYTWASQSVKFYNQDPELASNTGFDGYPPMKNFNFGVNLTF
jgi:TonB-linked SusC/RagA family outer membrane protein